jgi:hypothetical protein
MSQWIFFAVPGWLALAQMLIEHLKDLLSGWIASTAVGQTARLRALGNGVVLQRDASASSALLDEMAELLDHEAHQACRYGGACASYERTAS